MPAATRSLWVPRTSFRHHGCHCISFSGFQKLKPMALTGNPSRDRGNKSLRRKISKASEGPRDLNQDRIPGQGKLQRWKVGSRRTVPIVINTDSI